MNEDLYKALIAAQGEFEAVAKDSDNPFFNSHYASLFAVVKAATPILQKHGLAVTQLISWDTIDQDLLITRLVHESGQSIETTSRLHLTKQDPQGHGSAVTYMRRYAYMAILGLVADEDDDGNAASAPQKAPQATQWPSPLHSHTEHVDKEF